MPLHSLLCLSWCYVLAAAVWPQPVHYTHGNDLVWLGEKVDYTYSFDDEPFIAYCEENVQCRLSSEASSLDVGILDTAIERASATLFGHNIVPWKFHPRNSNFEPTHDDHNSVIDHVKLSLVSVEALKLMLPFHTEHINESYLLDMTSQGHVSIRASSTIGLSYGLSSFTQLFFKHSLNGTYTVLAPVHIADAPRFAHRGLNLDISRSFYVVEHITRTLDAMAYNKMNRLHLHVTDSQAWPLEVPAMPDLARKGAYGADMIYSTKDLEEMQRSGALLGVEVYLEIDMPGHTSSIHHAYPELIAAYNVQPDWSTVAAEPPSGTLKLNSSAVYDFLGKLWDDVLPRVSQFSTLMHTGGDEVNIKAYEMDDTVNSSDPAVIKPLLQNFLDETHLRIRVEGMMPIVWEEVLLNHNVALSKDVIVQTWLNSSSVVKVVEAGHRVIVGTHTHWYLDCGHGAWLDSGSRTDNNYPDWCGPRKNWRRIYSLDLLAGVPEHLRHLVLGGEVSLWSEQTDEINLDVMLWPRTAAAAEVLWSGARDMDKQGEASRRLAEMRDRLVAKGVRAEPVRMAWCEMEGGCRQ